MQNRSIYRSHKAEYYTIKAEDDWPIANLVVVFGSKHRPSRAELHCNSDVGAEAEELAVNTAREIIQSAYKVEQLESSKLEIRLLHVEQGRQTEFVDIPVGQNLAEQHIWGPWLWAAIAGILMMVVGLIWGAATLFNRSAIDSVAEIGSSVRIQDDRETTSVISTQGEGGGNGGDSNQAAEAQSTQPRVDPNLPQTNNLPASSNANSDLGLRQRIRVLPGAALTLRSEPGADAGEPLGYMTDAEPATIIGGPYWVQGESDTIVWWFVQLDSGITAWAPANSSQFTLLEQVPGS